MRVDGQRTRLRRTAPESHAGCSLLLVVGGDRQAEPGLASQLEARGPGRRGSRWTGRDGADRAGATPSARDRRRARSQDTGVRARLPLTCVCAQAHGLRQVGQLDAGRAGGLDLEHRQRRPRPGSASATRRPAFVRRRGRPTGAAAPSSSACAGVKSQENPAGRTRWRGSSSARSPWRGGGARCARSAADRCR